MEKRDVKDYPEPLTNMEVYDSKETLLGRVCGVERDAKTNTASVIFVDLEPTISRRYYGGRKRLSFGMSAIKEASDAVILAKPVEHWGELWNTPMAINGRLYNARDLFDRVVRDSEGRIIGRIRDVTPFADAGGFSSRPLRRENKERRHILEGVMKIELDERRRHMSSSPFVRMSLGHIATIEDDVTLDTTLHRLRHLWREVLH